MKYPFLRALVLVGILAGGFPAQAQLIWNPAQDDGATPGGSGAWLGANNWYSTSNVTWTSGSAAIFSGAAGTVTLGATTGVADLSFSTGGWLIQSADSTNRALTLSGSITVATGTVQIGSSTNPASISLGGGGKIMNVAAGAELILFGTAINSGNIQSGGITKEGDGLLTIVGPKTYVSGTTISGGTLSISDFLSLGGANSNPPASVSVGIRNGATLQITGTTTATNKSISFTANNGGTIEVTGSHVATIDNAIAAPSNVVFNKTGTGTLVLNGGITGGGTTNINGGTLQMNGTSSLTTIVNDGTTLSGTGSLTPAGSVQIKNGGTLLAGNGATAAGTLTIGGTLTTEAGSKIKMVLGPGGTHSTLARSSGTWTFASGQAFEFVLMEGATSTTYDNLITGLAADPGVGSWSISSPGITGSFVWDGTNVDLVLTAIPEPSAGLLLGLGLAVTLALRRRARVG